MSLTTSSSLSSLSSLRITGVVLSGGRSSRMGQAKALLPFGDESALQRVTRTVQQCCARVLVVGSPDLSPPSLPEDAQYLTDDTSFQEPFQGPLSGLLTAMAVIGNDADAIYLTGCDTPLLKPDFIRVVIGGLTPDVEIAVVDHGERLQPLAAAYRVSLAPQIQKLFDRGERSVQAVLRSFTLHHLEAHEFVTCDPELDSLKNMNTVEEYHSLLHIAGYAPPTAS